MTAAALLLALAASPAQWLGPPPPARVERVVTLAPSLTETVLALGAGAALVAVSRFDEAAEVASLPRVGGFSDLSVEAVLAVHPQLVVVLDVSDAGFTEARGVATALPVCPVDSYGVANVSDLAQLP